MTKKDKEIYEDLQEQLILKGMNNSYCINLIDKYMQHINTIRELDKDIKKRGILVEVVSGNGFTSQKHNESISLKQKEETAMLKILQQLGLDKPTSVETSDDDYL